MWLAVASVMASCAFGPDYRRPQTVTPPAYKENKDWKIAEPRDNVTRGKWWEVFADPQLNVLADKVTASNLSLRVAEANYRRAQALVQSARAALLPTVSAMLSSSTRFRPRLQLPVHRPVLAITVQVVPLPLTDCT